MVKRCLKTRRSTFGFTFNADVAGRGEGKKGSRHEVKLKLPTVLAGGYSVVALMQAWFGSQDDPRYPVFEGSSADRAACGGQQCATAEIDGRGLGKNRA